MLMKCVSKKILVCTPSNAAIDEIVQRLVSSRPDALNGTRTFSKRHVLRIGAMEYEPLEAVKKATLDYKLNKKIQKYLLKEPEISSNASLLNSPSANSQKEDSVGKAKAPLKKQTSLIDDAVKLITQEKYKAPELLELVKPLLKIGNDAN